MRSQVFSDSSQADSGTVAIVTHDPQQKVTTMSLGTNDTESPNHSPETPSRRRAGMPTGALLGAMALTAAVVGISAVAGAQDSSTDRRKATVEMAKTTSTELDDTTVMLEDDEAWAAFDQCLSDALGPIDEDGIKDTELTDDEWEALEVQWVAAGDACFDLLPKEAKAEAFKAYDDCLADAGLGDDVGAAVYVEDGEIGQSIQFGEDGGTVTITGDATGVSVTTGGDVSVLDDAAFEAAFEACDELLAEDISDVDEFDDFNEDDESDD